jgi:3-hydroxybutyryl-CoA dehydratase
MTFQQRTAYYFEDLQLGMEASFAKTVTEADIMAFAEVTGDKNPVHIDEDYAAKTKFKGRVAHGMLTAGYISAVFGMELPGPGAIYVSQTLNFRAPVRIGDQAIAKVKVVELIPAKRRARFDCVCSVGDTIVLEGEAILMVPRRPGFPARARLCQAGLPAVAPSSRTGLVEAPLCVTVAADIGRPASAGDGS